VKAVFVEGKRSQLLAGVDADGVPFAPLQPSTLRSRTRGPGGPLTPDGDASEIITGYAVTVTPAPEQVRIEAGWPGLPWVRYHQGGTARMARRDPGGFRREDAAEALRMFRDHIMGR